MNDRNLKSANPKTLTNAEKITNAFGHFWDLACRLALQPINLQNNKPKKLNLSSGECTGLFDQFLDYGGGKCVHDKLKANPGIWQLQEVQSIMRALIENRQKSPDIKTAELIKFVLWGRFYMLVFGSKFPNYEKAISKYRSNL